MNAKVKYIVISCMVILILLSVTQVFLLTSNGQEENNVNDEAYWLSLAENAWTYFQPGKGVNAQTGLHSAGLGWHYFTDWDLGLYIQATIDAEQLGILNKTGTWGADDRYDKILTFLETRELTSNGLPYLLYDSDTGGKSGDQQGNACDTGKLLVALQNLKVHRSSLAARINNIVYDRTNYEPFMYGWESLFSRLSIYDYYVTRGFAFFWPENFSVLAETFLDNIVSAPTVETYGVKLPKSGLSSEVLLHSVFELEPYSKLLNLFQQVYSAHEARYNATGKYTAFSEGNTDLDNPSYVYEIVVNPDGRTWTIGGSDGEAQISPIIFLKVAVGFQAIYNTAFARNMVDYIVSHIPEPTSGYMDGIDENGRVVSTTIDKTNGLIIGAAKYAISNLPVPTPTPTPSPTLSASPIPSPSPSAPSSGLPSATDLPSSLIPLSASQLTIIVIVVVAVVVILAVAFFVYRARPKEAKGSSRAPSYLQP